MKKFLSQGRKGAAIAPVSRQSNESNTEKSAKVLFFVCAAFSIVAVFTIVFYLLYVSIPVFREVGLFNFLFKRIWAGSHWADGLLPPEDAFGIFPAILSSVVVTAGAVLIGGFLGVCAAIFMVYYCPKKIKGIYVQLINLLAGIPSIVYGFVGLQVLVPLLQKISGAQSGMGPLAAVLVLSMMILPTVASISKNSIETIPKEYYEGALAMGNTKAQAVFKVCVPAAKKGIFSSLILGVGRAVGETMAVQMVIGNSLNWLPTGPFQGVCTLTTLIVSEMPYSAGLWNQALLAVGFILLCFILLINVALGLMQREKKGGDSLFSKRLKERTEARRTPYEFRQGGAVQEGFKYVCISLAYAVIAVLGVMVIFITVKGIPNLTWNFMFGTATNSNATLKSAFVSTAMTIGMTLLIALPIGIGAAIFLNEYSKKGSKLIKCIRLFIDTLSGIPSIVFGLFGMVFFVEILKVRCILAGALTMVLIILPTIIRSTEESLREVSDSMREASLALGASKVRTIFKIVLPSALSGIVTSVILSVGRIVGESAALIYTAGATYLQPDGYLSPGSTFAVLMYNLSSSGITDEFGQTSLQKTYATAFVLLVIVVCLNLLVTLLEKKIKRKMSGDSKVEKHSKPKAKEKEEAGEETTASAEAKTTIFPGRATDTASGGRRERIYRGKEGKQTI